MKREKASGNWMNWDQHHTGPGQLHGPLRQGQCLGTTAGRRVMMSQRETSGMRQARTRAPIQLILGAAPPLASCGTAPSSF